MTSLLTCLSWAMLTTIPTILSKFLSSLSPWIYSIPLAVILLIILYWVFRPPNALPVEDEISEPKPESREVVEFNRYAGGHPEINEVIHPCAIHIRSGILQICKYDIHDKGKVCCVGKIPMDSITEIRVEDVFTMKRKMTPESWNSSYKYFEDLNNRKGTEVAFTVIDWIEDKVHRSTYLCIEDDFAMEMAVKKRNAVMKKARQQTLQFA
jgi:hypothetical protein